MSVSLLDVNVLLALAWPTHIHRLAGHRWFAENFVRCAAGDAARENPDSRDVMAAMAQMTANGAHRFWPLEGGVMDIQDEIRARVVGHHQLTDTVLLDLAIRHQGRLATFDRRILGLLPADSVLRDALAVIPA